MIARITTGDNVRGMVAYNTDKVKNGEASLIMMQNINDGSQAGIQKMIQFQNNLNPRVKNRNLHVSLNFHKDDLPTLNEELLKEIAEEYMTEMGYEDQPYAVFQHFDASHPHIHIVSSRIGFDGRKINDSMERRRSKKISDSIENKHGLVVANDQSSMPGILDLKKEALNYVETGKGNLRNIIDETLYRTLKELPICENDFRSLLNKYNVDFFYDNKSKGLAYSLFKEVLKGDGEKDIKRVGKSLKASETTKKLRYNDLQAFCARNKKQKDKQLTNVRGRVFAAFNPIQDQRKPIGLSDFSVLLAQKGLKLNVLRAKSGNLKASIIGISYTDQMTGFKYTGEEIKLKWNKLSEFVIDDLSDLKSAKNKEIHDLESKVSSPEFQSMSEIEKILKYHGAETQNDYQEDLRKRKKKRRNRLS